jgi:hypothetical protein
MDVSLGNSCLRGLKFPRKKSLSLLSKFSNERVTDFGANATGEIKPRFLIFRTAENTQTFKKAAKLSLPAILGPGLGGRFSVIWLWNVP